MANSQPPFGMKQAATSDPPPAFKFWVEIEEIAVAEFKECSGLRMERTVETVEEGGVNDHVTVLPGRTKHSNIVLKYGVMDSNALWDWYQEGLYDGKVKRVDFAIVLRNVQGQESKRWNVSGGFPVKWEGPSLNVESNQVAVDTLEIAHHGLALAS